MSINNKNALFTYSNSLKRRRTLFPMPWSHKTTFNTGSLVPIVVQEVLPGGEWKIKLSNILRGLTPKYPVMDDAFLDVYSFFVPNRTLWDHWEQFISGMATPSDYSPTTEYTVPQVIMTTTGPSFSPKSLLLGSFWDYAGVGSSDYEGNANSNTQVGNYISLNALFPRGYVKIWNEWFRDENLQQPAVNSTGDENISNWFSSSDNPIQTAYFGRSLLSVDRYHDRFTSCLPRPQKGNPITIPLGGYAPVSNNPDHTNLFSPSWRQLGGGADFSGPLGSFSGGTYISGTAPSTPAATYLSLRADLSQATSLSINEQRLAFQSQRYLEAMARYGSRYQEYLQGIFGVYASDARLSRSEFLGGRRFPIHNHQVAQTAEDSEEIGLGATGAFSFTANKGSICHYTAKEHGILYILACVRTSQSYCQGIPKQFSRKTRFDYYNPMFAHIGEQPVLSKEIYADFSTNSQVLNDSVFGYNQAWSEYRFVENRVTGQMRPNAPTNIAQWHYARNFASRPTLNSSFITQGTAEVNRTLVVDDTVADQWIADFYFDAKVWNVMPFRSVPGLIDHDFH